ncbi:hypothetical protein Clacol_004532 [Clathrus columnatus]|uniref:Uncharacterized protein n=1 Tax=Clathrus columnatus TaxID=1419009 RepID=A0AAV5A6P7_9AGAM|nr:hypothetical protein Clacol_004532 [Clathrus columnatus]
MSLLGDCAGCDRVHLNLSTFYPVIAWVAEFTRLEHQDHPALLHHIDDAPMKARVDSEILADGSEACVINYGMMMHKMSTTDTLPSSKPPSNSLLSRRVKPPPPLKSPPLYRWWHKNPSVREKAYLRRRISREGHLLPLLLGTGIALLLELYATSVSHRTCFHYRGRPIYDFGIYRGAIRVEGDRTLAYFDPIHDQGRLMPERFQDPKNHFWLYFTTEDTKEEIFLDLGLFVYGFRPQVIDADYYLSKEDLVSAKRKIAKLMDVPPEHRRFIDPYAPALLADKPELENMYIRGFLLHKKKEKFSILRNEELLAGLAEVSRVPNRSANEPRWRFSQNSVNALGKFMLTADNHARTLKDMQWELRILFDTIWNGTRIVKHVLIDETWRHFPEPLIDLSRWELDTD